MPLTKNAFFSVNYSFIKQFLYIKAQNVRFSKQWNLSFFKFSFWVKKYPISNLEINAISIISLIYIFIPLFINPSKFFGNIFKIQVKANDLVMSL